MEIIITFMQIGDTSTILYITIDLNKHTVLYSMVMISADNKIESMDMIALFFFTFTK